MAATAPAERAALRPDRSRRGRYATRLPVRRFGTVTVYIPAGKPQSVAIFVSGDGGWELGVIGMAHALATWAPW